jgi:hypothetical protein
MSFGTFLQTIITIVFIYLILALIASEIQENIAAVCELRARRLKNSIEQMLGEKHNSPLIQELYNHPNISTLNQSAYSWISLLTTQRVSVGPSYISDSALLAETIVLSIKNIYTTTTPTTSTTPTPTTPTIKLKDIDFQDNKELKRIVEFSNNDWDEFKKNLQRQYDEVQERSSGVYKRNAKGLSFVIGFLVAIVANADAFNIITNLSKTNQNYSDNLIEKIEAKSPELFPAVATGGQGLTPQQRSLISKVVDETSVLPLGWDFELEMKKQKQADENKKKFKLIELLNNNQSKVELLSKNEGECKDEKGKTKCFDDLFNQIDSSKEVFPYLDPDFISKFNSSDRVNSPIAYANLLAKLKKEHGLKILKPIESSMELPKVPFINDLCLNIQKQGGWKPFAGWIVSAIAISMGAPFWFDVLGNIMNVRNSGRDLKRKRS